MQFSRPSYVYGCIILFVLQVVGVLDFASCAHGRQSRVEIGYNIVVGVNRTNLAWEGRLTQQNDIDSIAAAGIQAVRLTWRKPDEETFSIIEYAARKNVAVLLEIPTNDGTLAKQGAVPRAKFKNLPAIFRLSDFDPDILRLSLAELSAFLASGRPHNIIGIQLGNEINWAGFNGDLPVNDAGKAIEKDGRYSSYYDKNFELGLHKYVIGLKILSEFIKDNKNLPGTSLLSGGISDIGDNFAKLYGGSAIDKVELFEKLEALGALKLIDGLALHIYAPFTESRDASDVVQKKLMTEALSLCGRSRTYKLSCWVTEFGSASSLPSCVIDDSLRSRQLLNFKQVVGENFGLIQGVFYYDWNQSGNWDIYRCETLTSVGVELGRWSKESIK